MITELVKDVNDFIDKFLSKATANQITDSLWATGNMKILYSYFMPVCSIVKTTTPKCLGDLIHYCTRPKSFEWSCC